jgi:hypothetical protein
MYSVGAADPKIGRTRRDLKFPSVMHSIGLGIVVRKRYARVRPVRFRSAIEERAVLGVSAAPENVKGHFAITLFPSRSHRCEKAMRPPNQHGVRRIKMVSICKCFVVHRRFFARGRAGRWARLRVN